MPFIRSKWPYLLITALVLVGGVLAFALFRNDDPYPTTPAPQLPAPPLKELGERRGLQLGNFASLKYLRERPYAEIIAGQFEHAIIDGEPNWHFEDFTLRPGRDEYDFDHLDQVFDFADQHDMPVRVQHLLWGDEKWLPDWLKQGSFG